MVGNHKELVDFVNKTIKEGIDKHTDGTLNINLNGKEMNNLLKGFRVVSPSSDNKDYNYILKYNKKNNSIDIRAKKKLFARIKDFLLPKDFNFDFQSKIGLFDFNEKTLNDIPKALRTKEVCKKAMAADSSNFIYLPETLKSKYLDKTIQNNENFLSSIPEEERTKTICAKCLNSHNHLDQLFYIPHDDILQVGMTNYLYNGNYEHNLYHLVDKLNREPYNEKMLLQLTSIEPSAVNLLSSQNVNQKVYFNAYKNDNSLLSKFPDNIKNSELFTLAKRFYKKNIDLNFNQLNKLMNGEKLLDKSSKSFNVKIIEYDQKTKDIKIHSNGFGLALKKNQGIKMNN